MLNNDVFRMHYRRAMPHVQDRMFSGNKERPERIKMLRCFLAELLIDDEGNHYSFQEIDVLNIFSKAARDFDYSDRGIENSLETIIKSRSVYQVNNDIVMALLHTTKTVQKAGEQIKGYAFFRTSQPHFGLFIDVVKDFVAHFGPRTFTEKHMVNWIMFQYLKQQALLNKTVTEPRIRENLILAVDHCIGKRYVLELDNASIATVKIPNGQRVLQSPHPVPVLSGPVDEEKRKGRPEKEIRERIKMLARNAHLNLTSTSSTEALLIMVLTERSMKKTALISHVSYEIYRRMGGGYLDKNHNRIEITNMVRKCMDKLIRDDLVRYVPREPLTLFLHGEHTEQMRKLDAYMNIEGKMFESRLIERWQEKTRREVNKTTNFSMMYGGRSHGKAEHIAIQGPDGTYSSGPRVNMKVVEPNLLADVIASEAMLYATGRFSSSKPNIQEVDKIEIDQVDKFNRSLLAAKLRKARGQKSYSNTIVPDEEVFEVPTVRCAKDRQKDILRRLKK